MGYQRMRKILMLIVVTFVVINLIGAYATAQIKSCEELKEEIAKTLEEKKVSDYTLDIISSELASTLKYPYFHSIRSSGRTFEGKQIVGSCDNGKNKIVYEKKK